MRQTVTSVLLILIVSVPYSCGRSKPMPIQTGLPWQEAIRAISLDDVDQLRTLLAQNPSMTNMPRPRVGAPEPLLHFAASVKSVESVDVLLSLGADPNLIDGSSGQTPLQTIACLDDTAITRLLLTPAKC